MTVNEAIEILALEPGYSEADVIAAHRRIIQKVHPDRGGSDFLAAQINQAKEVLLA
jgi:curved DNA-binding protein CbpA